MRKETYSKEHSKKKGGLCPIDDIMNIISKKWALPIIGTIGNSHKMRFNKIMESLEDISPKTLADRLKEMERAGMIRREIFAEIPPRVEYSLAKDGAEVRDMMLPLMEWASKKRGKRKD